MDISLSTMAYGYTAKVLVNGTDIGITGGKSQGMRLFDTENPLKKEAAPEQQARLFVLKPGNNLFSLEFKKTGTAPERFSFDLNKTGEMDPFFHFESQDAEGKLEKELTL